MANRISPLLIAGAAVALFTGYFVWANRPGDFALVKIADDKLDTEEISSNIGREAIWKDESLARGLTFIHSQKSYGISGLDEALGSGACALDFNNDNWMDLYLVGGEGHTKFYGKKSWWAPSNSGRLFRNDGGVFTDVTATLGIELEAWGMGCGAGDLNNDGYSDLVVTTRKKNYLLKNIEGKRFDISALDESEQWSTSVTVSDVDNNGLLDIYIGNYLQYKKTAKHFEGGSGYQSSSTAQFNPAVYPGSANQLWLNRGNWLFEEAAAAYGIQNAEGRTLSHTWLDINRDGWTDLISVNDAGSTTRLFVNQKGKKFVPQELSSRLSLPNGIHDVEPMDFNRDGQVDLVFSSALGKPPAFLRNETSHSDTLHNKKPANPTVFTDDTWDRLDHTAELAAYGSWSTQSIDLNNDGHLDIVFANGLARPDPDAHYVTMGQPDTALISQGNGKFRPLATSAFESRQSSRSLVTIDADNDGDQDLLITHNNDPATLLINHTPTPAWVGLDLRNKQGHEGRFRTAEFITNKRTLFRYSSHETFLGMGDHRLLLSLDKEEIVEAIRVTWIDGSASTFESVAMNHYHVIEQGSGIQSQYGADEQAVRPIPARLAIWQIKAQSGNPREILAAFQRSPVEQKLEFISAVRRQPSSMLMAIVQDALADTNKLVQSAGIQALRHLESEYTYYWLEALLNSTDPALRCEVAEVFKHFFIEEEALLQHKNLAIVSLIGMLRNEDAQVKACAISALAESKSIRATAAIETLLAETKDIDLIRSAILALGELRQKSSIAIVDSYRHRLPAESQSALAKLRFNEERASVPLRHVDDTHASEDNNGPDNTAKVACLNIEPESVTAMASARVDALFRQCPRNQLVAWFEQNRPILESHSPRWITSGIMGSTTLDALITAIAGNPPKGFQDILLGALNNQKNGAAQQVLLGALDDIPFNPAIEKAVLTVLSNERLATDVRIAAGDVLIDHKPHLVLAYADQLFKQNNDHEQ